MKETQTEIKLRAALGSPFVTVCNLAKHQSSRIRAKWSVCGVLNSRGVVYNVRVGVGATVEFTLSDVNTVLVGAVPVIVLHN